MIRKYSCKKFALFPLLVFIGLISYLGTSPSSAIGAWTSNGPYGGSINSLTINPSNSDILVAGTEDGIIKTINGATTWMRSGLRGVTVNAVKIAPSNGNIIYAATDSGIYKSENSGDAWSLAGFTGEDVDALAIHPSDPSIAYIATNGDTIGIFKSVDGGASWEVKYCDENLDEVNVLLISPDNPQYIFAGIRNGYNCVNFCKSTDGGENWVASKIGRTSTPSVIFLATTPAGSVPSVIYAALGRREDDTYKSVFMSIDQGDTWQPIEVTDSIMPVGIAVNPNDPDVLYLGEGGSREKGPNFYKSTDGGDTWSAKTDGLPEGGPSAILVDPENGSIYVGFSDTGLFRSTNGAGSWSLVPIGRASIEDIAASPTDSETVFAAVAGFGYPRLAKTNDEGTTWEYLENSPDELGAVALQPGDPNTMFAGDDTGRLYKSTDSGLNWEEVHYFDGRPIKDICINPSNPAVILVAAQRYDSYMMTYYGGVFRNTDGGSTSSWDFTCNWWRPCSLRSNPNNHQVVYLGVEKLGYVMRSENGGIDWVNISPSSPSLL